ncbi:hypothetical protein BDB00DRAFT_783797 [Zychaea mexicana]|uniref:uncharacterized protein n=1 Tax=Zychaea mexicana TaxID=64656 RepID=UPI0022FE5194|nr:uncharacterized protein BDB00DRAFT_783797 [Zychaea mexicana]KAI9498677.1 hypothetical protein BDB00DRAFT_783797 [Zychaea mexicana]
MQGNSTRALADAKWMIEYAAWVNSGILAKSSYKLLQRGSYPKNRDPNRSFGETSNRDHKQDYRIATKKTKGLTSTWVKVWREQKTNYVNIWKILSVDDTELPDEAHYIAPHVKYLTFNTPKTKVRAKYLQALKLQRFSKIRSVVMTDD